MSHLYVQSSHFPLPAISVKARPPWSPSLVLAIRWTESVVRPHRVEAQPLASMLSHTEPLPSRRSDCYGCYPLDGHLVSLNQPWILTNVRKHLMQRQCSCRRVERRIHRWSSYRPVCAFSRFGQTRRSGGTGLAGGDGCRPVSKNADAATSAC